ncbi:hypothetical protein THUN1379_20870 [Paludibacterium sp. THUN1379]|uniref:hypothetical protein n=1 Tax=Paludibacterium sp. THUN1379 TaxID=3112107 RepID=UPI003086AB92|nr:hypothetical protein THUN1379_20870 [Paludibacterium sp. THUN1379]
MQIQGSYRAGQVASAYSALSGPRNTSNTPSAQTANFADVVTISAAARDRLAADQPGSRQGAVHLDTDKGDVALNLDDYFGPKSTVINGELPPLLMPSQRNIDAITQHLNQAFPAFLAANGIPAAPASINYDGAGQIQFPADYPYAAQLKQALQDTPGMDRELMSAKGLSEFKNLLDESQAFQQDYSAANGQSEINAVIARYSSLLSSNGNTASMALFFNQQGQMHIGKASDAHVST